MDRFELDVSAPELPADFTATGAASTLPLRPSGLMAQLQEVVLDVFADSDELLALDAVRQEVWLRLPEDVRGSWWVLVIGGNISATLAHLSDTGHLVRHRRGWSRRHPSRGDEAPAAAAPRRAARPRETPRAPRSGAARASGGPDRSGPPRQDGPPPLADGWEQDPLL
ncbi:hypothetical protein [Kineococcus rhizosphaerae]|uniref:Uncharacterized protein n=1 Tax=Kineococcus rhizosphaerae TaxID=559628 RepID=A0A2T0R6U8_9ACTN|nr:hypothetical protein [Kineococcus rhizosphaerae]PRY16831.1 hypothetical protein CLV37_103263 [Kineococcus rhizosphaerae]